MAEAATNPTGANPAGAGSYRQRVIELEKAHHTAVIALVDGTMVLRRELGWSRYFEELDRAIGQEPKRHRLLPVPRQGRRRPDRPADPRPRRPEPVAEDLRRRQR